MLAIVWLLSSKKSMTAQQLSERLEINVRTVYRYIDALCASGVPIIAEAGHDGGYRLPQTFKETPLFFEPNELLSLFHAASFAKGAGYPFEEELTKALEKIRHQLNDEQQHFLERHTSGFDVLFMQQTDSIASSLQQLEQAVAESQSVDILYDKRQGETSDERRIDPYGLYYQGNYWYIIAYCHLREGLRTFRVDRIRRLHLTSLAFERPKSFSLRDYIDRQWTQEPTMNVHIKGKPEIIDYLCRYFSQALQERKDNEAHFNINVEQVNGILPGFLVSFGTRVHVMQPSQLREAMAEVAQKLENYYKTNELS